MRVSCLKEHQEQVRRCFNRSIAGPVRNSRGSSRFVVGNVLAKFMSPEVTKKLGGAVDEFTKSVKGIFKAILSPFKSIFEAIKMVIGLIADNIGRLLVPVFKYMALVFRYIKFVVNWILIPFKVLMVVVKTIIRYFKRLYELTLKPIMDGVSWLIDQIGTLFDKIGSFFKNILDGMKESLNTLSGVIKTITFGLIDLGTFDVANKEEEKKSLYNDNFLSNSNLYVESSRSISEAIYSIGRDIVTATEANRPINTPEQEDYRNPKSGEVRYATGKLLSYNRG